MVDEAYGVAEWGHDFRPDYLRLHGAIAALGRPPVMAATATATPRVAKEIATRLGLREWVGVSSRVRPAEHRVGRGHGGRQGGGGAQAQSVVHVLEGQDARPAIAYRGTRKDTEEVAETIAGRGIATVATARRPAPRGAQAGPGGVHGGAAEEQYVV